MKNIFIGGLAVGVAVVVLSWTTASPGQSAPTIVQVHTMAIADVEDDRQLVGAVENIFVGTVVAQLGTKILDDDPETLFQVDVLENVKGSLAGKVVVNQQGGQVGDQLVLFDGDSVLKTGQTYLFATRPFKEMGWYTVVPQYGDLVIADAQQRASLVARFSKVQN
jgi:hypothetical protein